VTALDNSSEARAVATRLGIVDLVTDEPAAAIEGADLVIVCAPLGAYAGIGQGLRQHLKPGAILSDVGSVKQAVIRDLGPAVPDGVHFIPGHPIAGTEHSGPEAGFAELFDGRWAVLTPVPGTDPAALGKLRSFWEAMGSHVEVMEPSHHDQVLAITRTCRTSSPTRSSALRPISSDQIESSSLGLGFRYFTRIAASNPIMWRDIFLNNREAVLEMLGRFSEDLTALQRAIRWGEGEKLEDWFTRTRDIRRSIIDAKQA
jgi:cyclohexadieny/prephenate dehydrogenase